MTFPLEIYRRQSVFLLHCPLLFGPQDFRFFIRTANGYVEQWVRVETGGSAALAFFAVLVPHFKLTKLQAHISLKKSFPHIADDKFESKWKSLARFKVDLKNIGGPARPHLIAAPIVDHVPVRMQPSRSRVRRKTYSHRSMVAHAKALNKVSLMEAHAQQQRLDHSTAALRLYVSRLWIFCTLLTFSLWRHLLFGCLATRSKCSKMDMTRQHQAAKELARSMRAISGKKYRLSLPPGPRKGTRSVDRDAYNLREPQCLR